MRPAEYRTVFAYGLYFCGDVGPLRPCINAVMGPYFRGTIFPRERNTNLCGGSVVGKIFNLKSLSTPARNLKPEQQNAEQAWVITKRLAAITFLQARNHKSAQYLARLNKTIDSFTFNIVWSSQNEFFRQY